MTDNNELSKRTMVITYQHAYIPGTTALCYECQANDAVIQALPALGPVSHGAHHGECNGCEMVAEGSIRQLRDDATAAGDHAMVAVCDRALEGDPRAVEECAAAIYSARSAEVA